MFAVHLAPPVGGVYSRRMHLKVAPPNALRTIDKEGRRCTPIFRPVTFLVAFVVVLVAPRSGLCAIASLK